MKNIRSVLLPLRRFRAFSASSASHIRHWQVDAFTTLPFMGNPADVVYLNNDNKSDEWLSSMTAESHLPITSFLLPIKQNHYSLRWFTPMKEIELCGHGTMAAAHVLYHETKEVDENTPITFHTKYNGEVTAFQDNENRIFLNFPNTTLTDHILSAEDLHNLTIGLQLSSSIPIQSHIQYVGKSLYDIVIEVSPSFFHALPHDGLDFHALANINTNRGIILTSSGSTVTNHTPSYDFYHRMFLPRYGIDEDHVSGSAFCALAAYWEHKLHKTPGESMIGYQNSKRGGKVLVRISEDRKRVCLGGQCITTKYGWILV